MNFFSNFVPNKIVTFNGREPPLMTSNIKDKINTYREYLKKGKQQVDYINLQNTIKALSVLI